jgi:hypothetical protein
LSGFPVGTAVSANGTISSPVTAVRINVASITGSVVMTVIQAGMPGS